MNEATQAMKEKTRRMMKVYLASTPQERAAKVRAAMGEDRMAGSEDETDKRLAELDRSEAAKQMFEPPVTWAIAVAGMPVCTIPESKKKYPDFLTWWFADGRLTPTRAEGWAFISGPWVMEGRVELIPPADWEALHENERQLIKAWTQHIPPGAFYD